MLRAAGATGTSGPDLDRLQPAYLTIVNAVTNGGDHMPAFGGTLTAGQIADLATFVYDATQVSAAPAKVSVQAGRPTEFAFTLSRRSVPVGTTAFTIANRGKLTHTFKVCSSAKGGRGNACAGTGTRPIPPGRTATLTVTFTRKGSYEYLCTIPSHAAAGMKGLLDRPLTYSTGSSSRARSAALMSASLPPMISSRLSGGLTGQPRMSRSVPSASGTTRK